MCDNSGLWHTSRSRRVNVEQLVMMIRFLNVLSWRCVTWHLSHERLQIFRVVKHWQVDVIVELIKREVGRKLTVNFLDS